MKKLIIKIDDNNYKLITYHNDKNQITLIKSKIIKIDDNKYILITYSNNKKENNSIKSKIIYNKEQIEKLIELYLKN